jgi:hypothetical protein
MEMLGVALYLSVAHAPGFSTDNTHHFADTITSQVEYRYGGSHAFTFECGTNEHAFVEVLVPASDRSIPTIEFNKDKTQPQTSCSPHQYHEGFTMTSVVTKFKYDKSCIVGTPFTLHVMHGGNFAVVMGNVEDMAANKLWKMPYYYAKVGKWAGFTCPFTHVLLLCFLWAVAVVWGYHINPHAAIVGVWCLLLLIDTQRFAAADRVVGTCPLADSSQSNGRGLLRGLYAARLVVYLIGIMLAVGHHRKWSTRWVVINSIILFPFSYLLGVGLGLYVPLTAVYYFFDKSSPAFYSKLAL